MLRMPMFSLSRYHCDATFAFTCLQKIADRQGQANNDREPGTDLIAPRVTAPSCIWNVQMAKLR